MKTNPNDPVDSVNVVSGYIKSEGKDDVYRITEPSPGLTKREYFAAMAMQGILATVTIGREDYAVIIAQAALMNADALIAELNKERS